jgi:hypothetical protein
MSDENARRKWFENFSSQHNLKPNQFLVSTTELTKLTFTNKSELDMIIRNCFDKIVEQHSTQLSVYLIYHFHRTAISETSDAADWYYLRKWDATELMTCKQWLAQLHMDGLSGNAIQVYHFKRNQQIHKMTDVLAADDYSIESFYEYNVKFFNGQKKCAWQSILFTPEKWTLSTLTIILQEHELKIQNLLFLGLSEHVDLKIGCTSSKTDREDEDDFHSLPALQDQILEPFQTYCFAAAVNVKIDTTNLEFVIPNFYQVVQVLRQLRLPVCNDPDVMYTVRKFKLFQRLSELSNNNRSNSITFNLCTERIRTVVVKNKSSSWIRPCPTSYSLSDILFWACQDLKPLITASDSTFRLTAVLFYRSFVIFSD